MVEILCFAVLVGVAIAMKRLHDYGNSFFVVVGFLFFFFLLAEVVRHGFTV